MKKAIFTVLAFIILISVAFISPWATESFAKQRAIITFEKQWKHVQDGCGFNCKNCGFKTSKKVPFGRNVVMEYACGLLPSDSPEYHNKEELFVTFLGTVH
ncbi:hypothetical protein D3C73_553980 [compost metagenome]